MRKFLISILPLTAGLLFFSNTVLAGDIGSYYLKYFDDLGFSIIRPFADLTTDYEDFIDFIEKFRDSGQLLTEEEYLAQKEEMEKASDKPDSSEPSFDEEIADSFDEITVEKSKEEPATMQPYIFSKRPNRKEWQLVLSTDKLIDFDLGDTVFICNSPFATGIFSCDRDSVLSTVLEKKQIFVSPFGFEASVGLGERNGRKILVIPETILLVPSYREKLSEYLKTYITSLKFSYPIAGEVVTDGRTTSTPLPVEPFYKTLIESWVFETSLYVLAFTFFILLSKGILVRLVNSPKVFLKMETYTSAFSRLAKKLDSLGRLFGYAFFIFSAILVSLIVTISIKDRGELNLPYLSGYFFDIFKPANIASALREGRKTHILLYILACLESLTFLLWCAPRLYDLLSLSLQKIFSPKESLKESLAHPQLNQNFLKASLLFLISLGVFLGAVMNLSGSFAFLVLLLLLSLYLGYLLLQTEFVLLPKEKFVSGGVLLASLILGLGIRYYLTVRLVAPRYQDLIGINDSVVMLPYSKTHSKEARFDPMLLEDFQHSLFIDQWMVYHPDFSEIINTPISKDMNLSGSYVVMGVDNSLVIDAVLRDTFIRVFLYQQQPSKFLFNSNFKYDYQSDYSISLDLQCSTLGEGASDLSVKAYYNEITKQTTPLLHFPGCDSDSLISYTVPLTFDYIPEGALLLEIKNLNQDISIEKFSILKDGVPMKFSYLKESISAQSVLNQKIRQQDRVLHVYTYQLKERHTFKRENVFDLSSAANELKNADLVSDPFIIWSLDPGVLIRNDYLPSL